MNVVSRLIELGADVRARTEMGNTPLHIAAMEGHSQVVDYLMQAGASPGAKNARGQNAFDVAQGLVLRQTLMTAVLREENASGSAPVIAGVTRDASKDAERLRNLPPPPISGRAVPPPPSSSSSQAQPLPTQPFIRPDGFVTTVGNPELAAKYGNLTQEPMSAAERAPAPPQAWGVPTMDPASRSRPFARFARVFQRARARAPVLTCPLKDTQGASAQQCACRGVAHALMLHSQPAPMSQPLPVFSPAPSAFVPGAPAPHSSPSPPLSFSQLPAFASPQPHFSPQPPPPQLSQPPPPPLQQPPPPQQPPQPPSASQQSFSSPPVFIGQPSHFSPPLQQQPQLPSNAPLFAAAPPQHSFGLPPSQPPPQPPLTSSRGADDAVSLPPWALPPSM